VTYSEDTQTDFQTGDLYDVEADAGGYLKLAQRDVLSFDGVNDYINISPVETGNQFTIEVWCSPKENVGEILNYFIDSSSGRFIFATKNNHTGIGWSVYASSSWVQFQNSVNFGVWQHIALVFDGIAGEASLYINGEHTATKTVSSTNIGGITHIGKQYSSSSNYIQGTFLDLRIWEGLKTQTEIQTNMHKTLTGSETGLVAYYKLDEGTGTTAIDSAGNNDGTIYGATWQNEYVHGSRISPQINLASAGSAGNSTISWTTKLLVSENKNVSLGKAVTASTSIVRGSAGMLVDGNIDNYIELSTGILCYMQIDLGEGTFIINKIIVWHYYSDSRTYHETKTEVSEDGENWYTIFDSSVEGEYVESSSGKEHIFEPRKVRYIRDWLHGSDANAGNHWIEISVFGIEQKTGVFIETRISLDNGVTWTDWKPCTKDSTIPDLTSGTNVSNGLLECRQILSTNDSTVTPELHSLNINVEGTGSSLTAKFTSDKELNNVPLCLKLSNSSGTTDFDTTGQLTNSSNLTVFQGVRNLKTEISFWELNTYAELWALFPTIKQGENIFIIMQDDEANPNIGGIGSTQGQEVFQDFKAVYHLNQDPAAIKDSTGNNPDATAYNIITTDVSKDGTVLKGTDAYIDLGQIISEEIEQGQVHVSFKTADTSKPVLTKGTDSFNLSSTGTLDINLNETINSEIILNDNSLQTTSFSFDKHKKDLIVSGIDEFEFGYFGSNGLADILIGGNYLGPNFEGSIVDLRFNTKSRYQDDLVLQGKMWKENLIQELNEPQIIPAFSFDEGNTFKTYVNSTWKAVATNDETIHLVTGDSDWYYIDDTGAWNKAFQNNSNFALKQAMQFQENMCHVETIRNLNSAEWTSTGGMTAEGNLQIAFCYNSKIDNLCPSITDVNVDDKVILSCQSYDLEPYSTKITSSNINWEVRLLEGVNFDSAQIEVHSVISGGTWQPCTRNESIPDIVPGMDTTGKELQFKIIVPKDIPESVIINLIPKIQ
jgi:hypothetical protein